MRYRWLLAVFVPWLVLIALIVVAAVYKHVPIGWLTREMATTAGVHPFMGVISNIGAFLWSVTAAICLFSGTLLRQRRNPAGIFLLWTGVFSLVLLFDDFFMFHEALGWIYLGLRERTVYLTYGILSAAYLFCCRRQILKTEYRLLLVAFVAFALSLIFDRVEPIPGDWNLLPEDGFKLLGIFCWFGYHLRVAYNELAGSLQAVK